MTLALPILVLGLVLAVLIGVSLGLLGGGGSILTVPILVYVLGQGTHEAIATSLLVVGTTSLAALVPHARKKRVRWRTGLLFGATSMVGAFAAGRVAHLIPGVFLLLAFGGMMVVTAVAMMRKGKKGPEPQPEAKEHLPFMKIVLEGLAVGAVTGLVGAGGGFLVVPALVLLGGVPMREAVGTSLLVIAMKSFAAFGGHVTSTELDLGLATMVTGAAIVGSFGGAAIAGRVPQDLLRRGFAWFVVVMAVFLLAQEGPRAFGHEVVLARDWTWVFGLVMVPLVLGVVDLVRMRMNRSFDDEVFDAARRSTVG